MPVSKANQNDQPKEILGLRRITKKLLLESCKKNKLYQTPKLNDVLYLHYQGFQSIEELEEYTELKCLWLECNAISEIRGLECQSKLKCLFLQSNLIKRIENLECCKELDTLNLSQNHINRIENCGSDILPVLNTLNLASNYIRDAEGIKELQNCKTLSVLDLSNNRIDDILIVKVFSKMPELKVLVLHGNPVVSKIPQYRKTLILECKKLTYLDSRPVFPKDRACAEAWKRGGYAEERKENEKWNRKERQKITDSVNATIRMRNKFLKSEEQIDLIPNSDSEDSEKSNVKPKRSIQSYQDETEMDLWDEVADDGELQPTSSESNVSDTSSGIKSKDSNEWSSGHIKSNESNESLNPIEITAHTDNLKENSLMPDIQDYCLKLIDDIVIEIENDLQPKPSESNISDSSSEIKSKDSNDWSSEYVKSSESNEYLNPTMSSNTCIGKLKEDSTLSNIQDNSLQLMENGSYDKNLKDKEDTKCDGSPVNTDESSLETDEDVIQKFIKNVPEIIAATPEDLETNCNSYGDISSKLENEEDNLSIDFDFTNEEEDYDLSKVIEVTTNNGKEISNEATKPNHVDTKSSTHVADNDNTECKINEEFQRSFEELSANMDQYLSECYHHCKNKQLNGNNYMDRKALEDVNLNMDNSSGSDNTSDSSTSGDEDKEEENVQCIVSDWNRISKHISAHQLQKELDKHLAASQAEDLTSENLDQESGLASNKLETEIRSQLLPKILINDKPLDKVCDSNNFEIPFPADTSGNNSINQTTAETSQDDSETKVDSGNIEILDGKLTKDLSEFLKVNEYLEETLNQITEESSYTGKEELPEIKKSHIDNENSLNVLTTEEPPELIECLEITSITNPEKLVNAFTIEEINKCLETAVHSVSEELVDAMTAKELRKINKYVETMSNINTKKPYEINKSLEVTSNTNTQHLDYTLVTEKLPEIISNEDTKKLLNYMPTKELSEINKSSDITLNNSKVEIEKPSKTNKCLEVITNEGNKQSDNDGSITSQPPITDSTKDIMEGFEYIPLDVSNLLRRSELNIKKYSQKEEELHEILNQIEQENEDKYILKTEEKESESNFEVESISIQTICKELLIEIIESLDFTNVELIKNRNYQIDPKELAEEYCPPNDTKGADDISISSSESLPSFLNSYKDFLHNVEAGDRLLKYEFNRGQRRTTVKTSPAEKSACLEFLIKQANISEFNKDTTASLNAQLRKFYAKRMDSVRRMVDRVYAQKDKYDDTLELIDGKLMVVKKTGEIEDYLPSKSINTIKDYNDVDEFDETLETPPTKSYTNSLVPVRERQDTKVSLSIDWNLFQKSPNSWLNICRPQLNIGDNLSYLKPLVCTSKGKNDNLQLCKLNSRAEFPILTPSILRSQVLDNIDKEFFKKLNFDQIAMNSEEDDHEVVQCTRSYEELKNLITDNEVKGKAVDLSKEESELIEEISNSMPTTSTAGLYNNKEDLDPENLPKEDVLLQKMLKKIKEKDQLDKEKPIKGENQNLSYTESNGRFPFLRKMQTIKIIEYKVDEQEANMENYPTDEDANDMDYDSEENALPELTGDNIFTFIHQEKDNESPQENISG